MSSTGDDSAAKSHVTFMHMAIDMARRSVETGEGGPFGAVVVKDGAVVYAGHNEVLKTLDPTAHAEMTVIRRAAAILGDFKLTDCVLYTSCYPCPMCLGACLWAGLARVYYSATAETTAEFPFDDRAFYDYFDTRHTHTDTEGMLLKLHSLPMGDAARMPFKDWHSKDDKTPY